MKKKKEKQLHSVLNNIFYLLKDIYSSTKILFVLMLIEVLCAIVTPVFGIYLPKIAIDLVTQSADTQKVFMTLGLFVLLMLSVDALKNVSANSKYAHSNNMRNFYLRKISMKALTCDYKNIESADGKTRMQKAISCFNGGDWSGSSKMIQSMLSIFTSAVSFILYSSVLSFLNPLIILFLVGLTLINFAASAWARKFDEKYRDKFSEIGRKLWYVQAGSRDVKAGKDTRLYGMKPWFMSLRDNLLSEYFALHRKIQNRYYISGIVHGLTLLLRDGAAYAYLIYMVSNGKVEIGNFVLYFGAIAGFSGFINDIAGNVNNINGANVQMNDARSFLECSDSPEPENPAEIPLLDSAISISFRNVDFSYSSESGKILDNFNLEIKAGEKIALVGVNGAGKTTIVKLLCGFYTPDSGEVLINNINIKNFRKTDLYKLFSAVFQDIVIMPFTVGENVSMTVIDESDKEKREKIWKSLETAGLREAIEKYSDGIDSPMLKDLDENGIVLSGGQQQKLLMARALYKDAPLLILDEPTAALDPIAESETYEMFHGISKSKTALYISHRLASTRFCDRIIFLKDGKAAEIGSHAELMKKGGDYANMFEIQSHYYKKENGEALANG